MSLLSRAKSITTKSVSIVKITKEVEELALAWARDEITFTQAARVLEAKNNESTKVYITLARALKSYITRTKKI